VWAEAVVEVEAQVARQLPVDTPPVIAQVRSSVFSNTGKVYPTGRVVRIDVDQRLDPRFCALALFGSHRPRRV